jgi:hypothetical protein
MSVKYQSSNNDIFDVTGLVVKNADVTAYTPLIECDKAAIMIHFSLFQNIRHTIGVLSVLNKDVSIEFTEFINISRNYQLSQVNSPQYFIKNALCLYVTGGFAFLNDNTYTNIDDNCLLIDRSGLFVLDDTFDNSNLPAIEKPSTVSDEFWGVSWIVVEEPTFDVDVILCTFTSNSIAPQTGGVSLCNFVLFVGYSF